MKDEECTPVAARAAGEFSPAFQSREQSARCVGVASATAEPALFSRRWRDTLCPQGRGCPGVETPG